ncbi:MAG: type II toxin-antitoxin system CcdA family antitoxin [Candidatus Dormiibacterota bacterium]
MPRVNVYLSDELAAAVRPLGLNLSQVLQATLRERLASGRLDVWLGQGERRAEFLGSHAAVREVLEGVEKGQHHG